MWKLQDYVLCDIHVSDNMPLMNDPWPQLFCVALIHLITFCVCDQAGLNVFTYLFSIFPCLHSLLYTRAGGWENSRQLCKPSSSSGACITVENSPNPSSIYTKLCKYRKKVFSCICKLTLPRKNSNCLLWHWLKDKFLPVARSCTRTACSRHQFLVCKKRCFKKKEFFLLKCQLKRKKELTQYVCKFQPTREWVNKVNLSSFQLKNFFKFVLAWLAPEKQNILTLQPCYILSSKHASRPIRVCVLS